MLTIQSICHSDQWQGSAQPTLAVPVDKSTTLESFTKSLHQAYIETPDDYPVINDFDSQVSKLCEDLGVNTPFEHIENDGGDPVIAYVIYYNV